MTYRYGPDDEVIHCDVCNMNPATIDLEIWIGDALEAIEVCRMCAKDDGVIENYRRTTERICEEDKKEKRRKKNRMSTKEEARRQKRKRSEHKAKLAKKHRRSTTN